ncbi:hypothetical protein M422DRAFT_263093 [Sphaerobolus stellatus SS14]|uniref:Cyanovirin-N domain-containing protein n=1 Tax=Sphaerobolus stellatus (strain SS14) TaxID=990650 RepID=A0A0C9VBL8_SPHS4|nr:hypothetical protein M422DRAFT_263093 [Sphaerobolus stellatus SS14]
MYTLKTLFFTLILLYHQSVLAAADLVPRDITGCQVQNDPNTPSFILIASCLAPDGSMKESTLDFSKQCLGNTNGVLTCGNVGLGSTCGGLFFEAGTSIVQGVCKAKNQSLVNSNLDLNNCVQNNAGILGCKT